MRRYWLLLLSLVLASAIVRGQTLVRPTLPVPDVPGFKTLKADFHLHTVFSDGNVWPTTHVQDAWRDGLDVIALTEHAEYTPHAADVKVDIGRSYVIAKPLADQLGVILVPGVEITKPDPPAPLVLPEAPSIQRMFITNPGVRKSNDVWGAARARRDASSSGITALRVSRATWFQRSRARSRGIFRHGDRHGRLDEAYPWTRRRLTYIADSDLRALPPRTARCPDDHAAFEKTADMTGPLGARPRRPAAWQEMISGARKIICAASGPDRSSSRRRR